MFSKSRNAHHGGGRRSTGREVKWLALDDEDVGVTGVGDDALLRALLFFIVDHRVGLPLHDAETYVRERHAGADFGPDVVEVVDLEHLGSRLLCSHAWASGADDLGALLVAREVHTHRRADSLLDGELQDNRLRNSATGLFVSRHDHLQV